MGRFNKAMASKLAPTMPMVGKAKPGLKNDVMNKKKKFSASPLAKAFGKQF